MIEKKEIAKMILCVKLINDQLEIRPLLLLLFFLFKYIKWFYKLHESIPSKLKKSQKDTS